MKKLYISLAVLALGAFAFVLGGVVFFFVVRPISADTRPAVIIHSPPSGSEFKLGQDLAVQSLSSDPQGIQSVELLVDGMLVRSNPAPLGQPSPQLTLMQTWNPDQAGMHILTVRATNARGNTGQAAINLTVVNPTVSTPTPSATIEVAPTAVPTTGSQNPSGGGCSLRADFVADVTIPDGTIVPASGPFVKTWRVKNSGCAWDSGLTLVWASGEQMGAVSPALAPIAATGATVDLSVPMTAPATPGAHVGEWRLRAPNGSLFGDKLTVVINVHASPAAETPTQAPTAPPPTEAPPPPPETETPTPPPTDPPPPTPTVPATPSAFNANGTGTTIHFTWTDNSTAELGFRIYQVGQVAPVVSRPANVGTGGMAFDWAGRPCNMNATLYVKAYNAAGESASSNTNAAVTIPCQPTGFNVLGVSASSVNVSFADNATNEAGYRIYRVGSGSVLETLGAHAGTGAHNGVVNPVICGQSYTYYVRAFNSAGESASSNSHAATTAACTVTVTFTSVHVYDDTDTTGAGEIWLDLHVNGHARRWPASGTVTVNSGENKTLSGVVVAQNLMRTTNLTINVVGQEKDLLSHDDLGTVTANYAGASGWSEGAHCAESASPHKFRICYNISVTP